MPYAMQFPIDRVSFAGQICMIDYNSRTARIFIRPEDVASGHITFVTYNNSTFIERAIGQAAITLSVPLSVEQNISQLATSR